MTWHQVSTLPLTPLCTSSSWSMSLLKGAGLSRTRDSHGVCTVQNRARWLNCFPCPPEDRLCEGLDSGCISHCWVPSAQHRGGHKLQKTSVIVCSLLLQDTKYLPGLPNFSGIHFTSVPILRLLSTKTWVFLTCAAVETPYSGLVP